MDFKQIGLNQVWSDLKEHNELRPLALFVIEQDEDIYEMEYPEVNLEIMEDVLTLYGAMARFKGADQVYFYFEGGHHPRSKNADENHEPTPRDDFKKSVIILKFCLSLTECSSRISFAEYKKPGKELWIGPNDLEMDGEGSPSATCFFEGFRDPFRSLERILGKGEKSEEG